jgi:tetratricopeptide (TPR) repeat protein
MNLRGLILTFLLAGTALVFAPMLGNDFVIQDDFGWIAQHPRLNPPTMENLAWFWSPKNATEGLWVPLSYTVWSALSLISHRPVIFHAASLGVHLLSVAMVWIILTRLLRHDIAAALGAMLFAIHPLQVESVTWASGLKDLLAALLTLVAIDQYIRSADAASRGQRTAYYSACVVAFVAAMLAKPSAVVMPLLAGVIDLWFLSGLLMPTLRRVLPLLVLALPFIWWARQVQTMYPELATPLWLRPLVAADALAFYAYKLVFPLWLANLYGRTPPVAAASGWLWISWVVPGALGVALYLVRRRMPHVVAGALLALLAILPVLGFTPFLFQLYSTVADHYMYLPMFGIALIAGSIATRFQSRGFAGLAIGILVLLGIRSSLQTRVWRDSITLFTHAVNLYPGSAARSAAGKALAAAGRLDEAIPHFQILVDSQPSNPEAQLLLGRALLETGQYPAAAAHLEYAARLRPDDSVIAYLLDQARRHLASPATTQ